MARKIAFTKGSGNVFADLGLKNSEELLAKSKIAIEILRIIKGRKLTQAGAAKILGTNQSQISLLKNGDCLRRFTLDRLVLWLTKLDHNVTLTVKRKPRNQGAAAIQVSI